MTPPTSSDLATTVFHDPHDLRLRVQSYRHQRLSIGLVPTMGALHDGHLSLVRASMDQCDRTVVTIFVNPTQFGAGEDFESYPRTLEADRSKLSSLGAVDVLAPPTEAIFPAGHSTTVTPPVVSLPLEGEHRPSHFQGVATVVLKLFHLVPSDCAFFGQKDFQQCRVIEQMVADLNVPIKIVRCPIVREQDGLAMSSRNQYLSSQERIRALSLNAALNRVETLIDEHEHECDIGSLEVAMRDELERGGVDSIDYATIADPVTMLPLTTWTGDAVAMIAAHVGATRLIDNRLWQRGA